MKKKIVLLVCCLVVGLMGCGSDVQSGSNTEVNEDMIVGIDPAVEEEPAEETEETEEEETPEVHDEVEDEVLTEESAESEDGLITEEQALQAVKNYWFSIDPELEDMLDSDEYTVYFEVSTNDEGQIVVLYRSYTAAETRYYVDPETGKANITELVPGIIDEETASNEAFNVRDYM